MSEIRQQANALTKALEKEIFKRTEILLMQWCDAIINTAINERMKADGSHNFTGNLLNSIVVGLYMYGQPRQVFYAGMSPNSAITRVRVAKFRKMSYRAKRRYVFRNDYSGTPSVYKPEIETNKGWGLDDAINFYASYKPKSRSLFHIVICYPVEYASFVENERQTTGILATRNWVERTAVEFIKVN